MRPRLAEMPSLNCVDVDFKDGEVPVITKGDKKCKLPIDAIPVT
ncbi:MAG: hypothetical protein ACTXOO_05525 [Sodalis sp. (in: enterobacteria)]